MAEPIRGKPNLFTQCETGSFLLTKPEFFYFHLYMEVSTDNFHTTEEFEVLKTCSIHALK